MLFIALSFSLFSSGNKEKGDFIGVVLYKEGDAFIENLLLELEKESEGRLPVKVVYGANSQLVQNEKIEELINQEECKAMIINAVDRTSAGLIVEKLKQKNIPCVFFNREPLSYDFDRWPGFVYYVGSDPEKSGEMEGELFYDYLIKHPDTDKNGDLSIQYLMIKGENGQKDTELRTEYMLSTILKKGISLEKIGEVNADWDREKAKELTAKFINKDKEIEAVFANNDEMALGAIDALMEAGYFTDEYNFIPVIGTDGIEQAMEAIEEGLMIGTVSNSFEDQARAIYNIAYELSSGGVVGEEAAGFPIENSYYVWIPFSKVISALLF